jgi:hypothetical protein
MATRTHPFNKPIRKPALKAKQTAKNSMDFPLVPGKENLTQREKTIDLVDRKFELTLLKQRIEQELAEVDTELKDELENDEAVYGSNGVGYRLVLCHQDIYDETVVEELADMNLLKPFVRISTSRLKELVRNGDLPQQKFEELQQSAEVREIPSLREVILEASSN